LQEARYQLRQQGGKQHVRLAAAAAAADVPALKLPFDTLWMVIILFFQDVLLASA